MSGCVTQAFRPSTLHSGSWVCYEDEESLGYSAGGWRIVSSSKPVWDQQQNSVLNERMGRKGKGRGRSDQATSVRTEEGLSTSYFI